ncbi:MAG: molybdate ABC transporter substrate-binding protein, partial [bacterium]
MKRGFRTASVSVLVLLSTSVQASGLLVFAAASLTDCLTRAGALYQREHGQKVEFSFEASSLLAAEIERGAPADLFASADEAKMDQLVAKGLVVRSSRRDLLTNTLVAVARADSPLALRGPEGLLSPGVRQMALAD